MSVLKLSSVLLFAFASLLVPARPASAQSFATNTRVTIDDQAKAPADRLFINKNQCRGTESKDPVDIDVEIANLSATHKGVKFLEFWVAQSGQDCHSAALRKVETNTGRPQCTRVPVETVRSINGQKQPLSFTAQELFSNPYLSADEGTCILQGAMSLFIVPLASETTESAQADGIGPAIKISFEVDFDPLNPPGSVRGGSGETTVTLRWQTVGSDDPLTNYKIFVDTSATSPAGGPCPSELLVEGEEADIADPAFKSKTTKGTSQAVNPADYGIDVGEQVPAAVLTIDAAGNPSLVSNVVCIQRVATSGFWDVCNADEKCADSFDTCSLSHAGARSRGGWILGTFGMLGLALWVRRRRTV